MAFTGAISGLFSCGRARRPQTRDEVDAAGGTSGEGGNTSSDPEFAHQRVDATTTTTTNVTDKENNLQAAAPPQLTAPRFSEELFPFAAIHPVPAVPAPAPVETTIPKLEHVPEERAPRISERKDSSDAASKAGKGTQVEHRILVTAVAKPEHSDAPPKLKVDHVTTSFNTTAPVTKTEDVTPAAALESHDAESPIETAEDAAPTTQEQSPVPVATPVPAPQPSGPMIAADKSESTTKPVKPKEVASISHDEPPPAAEPVPVLEAQDLTPVVPVEAVNVEEKVEIEEKVNVEEKMTAVNKAEKALPRTAPTLLTLPQEVRKVIYAHMTEDAPIRMCRHDDPALANPDAAKAGHPARQFYSFTQVCHQLRTEFLPIYEQRAKYMIDLWTQRTNLIKIDTLKGEVAMDIDAACFDMQPIDLLPLIRYLARSGRTNCRFASTEGVVFKSIESTVEQLNKLLPSQRKNDNWLAAIQGPMKRVDLHLFPHDDIRQYYRFRGAEPMLRIVYPSAVIESWMKQSHNTGAEYEEYLDKFGLGDLDMHVVVGHASRRKTNEGRMPLDWRLSYVGSRLSLDQAVRISGTFSR